MEKLIFFVSALLISAASMSQSCLIADYPFSGNANDATGNGFNGSNNNATLTTDRFGNANGAYDFNGTNAYIELNDDFDYTSRTVNLWFNADNITTGINWLFATDHPSLTYPSCNFYTIEVAGTDYVRFTSGSGGTNNYDVAVSTGSWHMVTTTMDNSDVKYYLDGQLVTTLSFNSGSSTSGGNSTALIGCSRLIDRFFDGKIDDVTIHDCVLDSNTIDSLYNTGPGVSLCVIADYPFNGNANDETGNGYDGTVNGPSLSTDRFGNSNSAYDFDGTGDYIELNDDFDYTSRSVNLWFNADNITNGINWLFATDHPTLTYPSCNFYTIELGGVDYVRFTSGSGGTNNYDVAVSTGSWHMVTTTMDNSSVNYYLDGQLVTTLNFNSGSSTSGGNNTALIGCSRLIDRFFDGKIDDVSIYDCVLDSNEVEYLYTGVYMSIPEQPAQIAFNVYPNPTSGMVTVSCDDFSIRTYDILDMGGRIITTAEINRSNDVSELSAGMYFIRVGNSIKRLIITE